MDTKLTNQDIIDLVEGSLPPDRVELVRAALAGNPELAAKLRKLAADRGALRVLGGLDARQPVPAGLVDRAMAAAARPATAELRLATTNGGAGADRARHRRPKLASYRWPAAIAAALTVGVLALWAVFIIRATDPDADRLDLAKRTMPEYVGSEQPEPDSRAIVEGRITEAEETAGARELERRLDALHASRAEDSGTTINDADAVIADLLNPTRSPNGLDGRDLVEQAGLTPIELGDALLDGRVRVVLHTRFPERILASAARLDGAPGPADQPILVHGETSAPRDADYAKGEPGATQRGGAGRVFERTVAISFGVPTDAAIPEAVAEFERLLGALGEGCDSGTIVVSAGSGADAPGQALDADRAIWWEGGPASWVWQATARLEVVVTDAPAAEPQGPPAPGA